MFKQMPMKIKVMFFQLKHYKKNFIDNNFCFQYISQTIVSTGKNVVINIR